MAIRVWRLCEDNVTVVWTSLWRLRVTWSEAVVCGVVSYGKVMDCVAFAQSWLASQCSMFRRRGYDKCDGHRCCNYSTGVVWRVWATPHYFRTSRKSILNMHGDADSKFQIPTCHQPTNTANNSERPRGSTA